MLLLVFVVLFCSSILVCLCAASVRLVRWRVFRTWHASLCVSACMCVCLCVCVYVRVCVCVCGL